MPTYKVALTVGVFDMLHQGHVELFNKMLDLADELIVIVHDDYSTFLNKQRFPVQSLDHRLENIEKLLQGKVTVVRTYNSNPAAEISFVLHQQVQKYNRTVVYVRGDDWKDFPGKNTVEGFKVPIVYKEYTEGVSSTKRRSEL